MTDEHDAETSAVAKLAHLHPDEFILFTAAEAQALRKVAIWYQRLEGAVALGGVLGEVLKWAIVIGAGIAAAKAGLLGWLGIGGTGL